MFYVHPYLGKIPILTNMFQMGWNHQLVLKWFFEFQGTFVDFQGGENHIRQASKFYTNINMSRDPPFWNLGRVCKK